MDRPLTPFEVKTMRYIAKHNRIPEGDSLVQYAGAARRLERRGLTTKPAVFWHLTAKGEQALHELETKGTDR